MPEYGATTPKRWRRLESFLWHDFDAGPEAWARWASRMPPRAAAGAAGTARPGAIRLHAALRSLQAANSGIDEAMDAPRAELNRLVVEHDIRPRLDGHGVPRLVPGGIDDPVAPLLVLALEAMQAGAWRRFKLCREPSCRASFFDGSKATTKTWCAMRTCGSRNKMRRYRAGP